MTPKVECKIQKLKRLLRNSAKKVLLLKQTLLAYLCTASIALSLIISERDRKLLQPFDKSCKKSSAFIRIFEQKPSHIFCLKYHAIALASADFFYFYFFINHCKSAFQNIAFFVVLHLGKPKCLQSALVKPFQWLFH